jgi:hypothetical protein
MKRLLEIKDKYVELSKGYIDYEKLNNYLITYRSGMGPSRLTEVTVRALSIRPSTPGSHRGWQLSN